MLKRLVMFFCVLFFCGFIPPAFGEHIGTFCWVDSDGDYLELAFSTTGISNIFSAVGASYDNVSNPPVMGNFKLNDGYVDGTLMISGRDQSGGHFDTFGSIRFSLDTLHGDWLATTRLYDATTGQIQLGGKSLDFTPIACDQILGR